MVLKFESLRGMSADLASRRGIACIKPRSLRCNNRILSAFYEQHELEAWNLTVHTSFLELATQDDALQNSIWSPHGNAGDPEGLGVVTIGGRHQRGFG